MKDKSTSCKRWYEKNKEKVRLYRKRNADRLKPALQRANLARCRRNKQWLRQYKQTLCCKICQESDSRCLDFHHRNPQDKIFSLGNSGAYGAKRMLIEIAKCDVLCSNCHRKLHLVV